MNHTKDRSGGRRMFRLECLEDRNLLSTFPTFTRFIVPAPHPPLPNAAVIKGSLNLVRASDGLYTGTQPGRLSYSGNGMSSPANFGNVTFGMQQTETPQKGTAVPTTKITLGRAVLTSRFGEQVQINYNGQETLPRHQQHPITLAGTINSGTGRFIGAAGTFFATGRVVNANTFALNFTLTPIYKVI